MVGTAAPRRARRAAAVAVALGSAAAYPSISRYGDGTAARCTDKHEECPRWAATGQCRKNQGFMKLECAHSCHSCGWKIGEMAPVAIRVGRADEERLMQAGTHGTCVGKPQTRLRWSLNPTLASRIGCFNRKGAEPIHSWETSSLSARLESMADGESISFYDSVTGKPLFVAPRGRSIAELVNESRLHGWPSFRDEEVVTRNVRVLRDGETVSVDGTHLGHLLPDGRNRYVRPRHASNSRAPRQGQHRGGWIGVHKRAHVAGHCSHPLCDALSRAVHKSRLHRRGAARGL